MSRPVASRGDAADAPQASAVTLRAATDACSGRSFGRNTPWSEKLEPNCDKNHVQRGACGRERRAQGFGGSRAGPRGPVLGRPGRARGPVRSLSTPVGRTPSRRASEAGPALLAPAPRRACARLAQARAPASRKTSTGSPGRAAAGPHARSSSSLSHPPFRRRRRKQVLVFICIGHGRLVSGSSFNRR
jgi:hypothetical protein